MLHGEIKINHHVVGEWQVVNKGKPVWHNGGDPDLVIYEGRANYNDLGRESERFFYVLHDPANGAWWLAIEALRQATVEFGGYPKTKQNVWMDFCDNYGIHHYSLLD
jgi:hypothetical protein